MSLSNPRKMEIYNSQNSSSLIDSSQTRKPSRTFLGYLNSLFNRFWNLGTQFTGYGKYALWLSSVGIYSS